MTSTTIIAVGELLVEFVSHQEGCELRKLVEYSGPYPSGAPAICIDQASRVGATTQIFGAVGDDNFGKALTDRLAATGVGTTGISNISGKSTGVAFVSYYSDGSRTFIFHLNNTAADAIDFQSIALPDGPLILHVSGSSLGNPNLRVAIESVAEQVIQRGGKISCDPNARPELMSDPIVKKSLRRLVENSSFLFPSDVDLEYLYPDKSISDAITSLLADGTVIIALTQGERGSTIYSKDHGRFKLAGHQVNEIDPTGAGDCYCGTFLAMAAAGSPVDECGRYANAAGAMAVTKRGPMEGNSNLQDIESFIKNNPAIDRD
ncbi:MAG: carbohydrate kinase family protein [Granulosicoccus sp.]